MSYFIAVQKKDGLHDVVNYKDVTNDMEKVESLYIPTYFFTFSDGSELKMTDYAARLYCRLNGVTIKESTKMHKSTFGLEYHGYHPGLGCETHGKEHVQRLMRERGLIEAGDQPPTHRAKEVNPISGDVIRDFVNCGAKISDNEAKALIEGTYKSEGSSDTSNE